MVSAHLPSDLTVVHRPEAQLASSQTLIWAGLTPLRLEKSRLPAMPTD